jgi:hypothetical protein
MSALGQKPTYALQQAMSALHPIATAKADMPQMVMSALHLKADMCSAVAHVGFGPKADIGLSLNHLIGASGNKTVSSISEGSDQQKNPTPYCKL